MDSLEKGFTVGPIGVASPRFGPKETAADNSHSSNEDTILLLLVIVKDSS